MEAEKRLSEIAQQLLENKTVEPISVRQFLSWFGAQRRGSWAVQWIRGYLREAKLVTVPDFDSVYIDAPINFYLVADALAHKEEPTKTSQITESVAVTESVIPVLTKEFIYTDPTYRINKLEAANNKPVSVKPDSTLQAAITIMLLHDFSQLPVMTSDRDVKGIITWTSIGTRLAVGDYGSSVREFMDPYQEISATSSLFKAIPIIVQHQYVLVRGKENLITGIVTASDLSLQFQQLAEPFLLLGEIENHIRVLIGDKFSASELNVIKDPEDAEREVKSINDLTFGEYIRLLENPDRWTKINLPIDRATFCEGLERVRKIRNDVMHFDPDPLGNEDLNHLRDFTQLLQRLQSIGIPKSK